MLTYKEWCDEVGLQLQPVYESNTIPSVLHFGGKQSSISTERALKRAVHHLEQSGTDCEESIDDLKLMLSKIRR